MGGGASQFARVLVLFCGMFQFPREFGALVAHALGKILPTTHHNQKNSTFGHRRINPPKVPKSRNLVVRPRDTHMRVPKAYVTSG